MKEHRIKKLPVQRIEAGYSLCSLLKRQDYDGPNLSTLGGNSSLWLEPQTNREVGWPNDDILSINASSNADSSKSLSCGSSCCCSRVPHHPTLHSTNSNSMFSQFNCSCLLSSDSSLSYLNQRNAMLNKKLEALLKQLQETLIANPNRFLIVHLKCSLDQKETIVTLGKNLLEYESFSEMYQLVEGLFFQEKKHMDPDFLDNHGRTMLSYAIGCADDNTLEIIKALFNAGANVWKTPEKQSPFTLFLKTIIRRGSFELEQCGQSLHLLCLAMANDPSRMHWHVMQTMFHHARHFKILGPVFSRIKSTMMPYWSGPLELKALARQKLRHTLLNSAHRRLNQETLHGLGLPKSLGEYLLLN